MQTQKQPVLSAVSPKHAPNVLMVPPRRLAQGGSLAAHGGPQLARDPRGGERREHGGVGARRERERERALTSRESPPPPPTLPRSHDDGTGMRLPRTRDRNARSQRTERWRGECECECKCPPPQLGDASLASPFTSRTPDISSVLDIMRQGASFHPRILAAPCTLIAWLSPPDHDPASGSP